MFKRLISVLTLNLILIFLVSGCGNNNEATEKFVDLEGFSMESIDISSIGTGIEKYAIERSQKDDTRTGQSNTEILLAGLSSIGSHDTDLNNKDNPVTLIAGNFYDININFNTKKLYPTGLNFDVILVDVESNKSEDIYSKLLTYGTTKVIDETGEQSLRIQTHIPTDVSSGKYILVTKVIDGDLEKLVSQEKNITSTPEMGAIYVDIEHTDTTHRLEHLDINGSKYIDLAYTPKFNNGYTNTEAGHLSLSLFSSSHKEENLTISAFMELENGTKINLALLDTQDGVVKDTIIHTIVNYGKGSIDNNNIALHYYFTEAQYTSLST